MRRSSTRSHFLYCGLLCAALLCCLVPDERAQAVRAQAFSTLAPVLKFCRIPHPATEPASITTRIADTVQPGADPASATPAEPAEPPPEQLAARLDWLTAENLRLRYALGRARNNAPLDGVDYEIPRGINAQVIARKTLWQEPFFGLDRGAADGVQLNAGVLHRGAVLGRIVAVAPHASSMALLTDPGLCITARLADCRLEGVLRGARDDGGEQACKLSIVAKEAPVKPGEHVLTSGYDGAFPSGLWLGDAVSVKKTGDVQWEVTVRPACKENLVENVQILSNRAPNVPWPNLPKRRRK